MKHELHHDKSLARFGTIWSGHEEIVLESFQNLPSVLDNI
jgi:hypothetical protein